ncbi:helix-turn-helix Fis-type [Thermus scotoductus SA-01]|uniref:Helix-turn-helix Fis-type n=2 Tax=Thermaceae TaxID=188786 RepID=E8PPG9_THESS|nr:helix-turn-helix Fis-type [Thermus scotoductus SA-01]
MGMARRYTKREVLKAIEGSGGVLSTVARRLGCSWHTAQAYVQRWPETQEAFQAERERILDLAEATLFRAVQEGDVQAAKWVLSRLGKSRGYGDHVEVSGHQAVEVVLRWPEEEEEEVPS